ncbi:hypothetical protein Bca52824_064763 [Brassica carinata]|uniref:Zinc finger LSD1-type domain-containing protein n=1 Tax=Brassica carinata TaxID=52824 RepID=A0A8X7QIH2_BRACI|nr:hypothetical protein Bca52824_064763 [Brassica carinata]
MPVPLAPYPTPPAPALSPSYTPPPLANGSTGGQSQLVCSGCRNLLMYPVGASSVCCAVCNAVTAVPPPGTEMARLVCGGCHTLLMYIRGATIPLAPYPTPPAPALSPSYTPPRWQMV